MGNFAKLREYSSLKHHDMPIPVAHKKDGAGVPCLHDCSADDDSLVFQVELSFGIRFNFIFPYFSLRCSGCNDRYRQK